MISQWLPIWISFKLAQSTGLNFSCWFVQDSVLRDVMCCSQCVFHFRNDAAQFLKYQRLLHKLEDVSTWLAAHSAPISSSSSSLATSSTSSSAAPSSASSSESAYQQLFSTMQTRLRKYQQRLIAFQAQTLNLTAPTQFAPPRDGRSQSNNFCFTCLSLD
jgi:hypothetical protein